MASAVSADRPIDTRQPRRAALCALHNATPHNRLRACFAVAVSSELVFFWYCVLSRSAYLCSLDIYFASSAAHGNVQTLSVNAILCFSLLVPFTHCYIHIHIYIYIYSSYRIIILLLHGSFQRSCVDSRCHWTCYRFVLLKMKQRLY